MPLFLLVVVPVFPELGFFFAKQFLEHRALLKIGRDIKQCPVVFNVLLNDETLHKSLRKAQPPSR